MAEAAPPPVAPASAVAGGLLLAAVAALLLPSAAGAVALLVLGVAWARTAGARRERRLGSTAFGVAALLAAAAALLPLLPAPAPEAVAENARRVYVRAWAELRGHAAAAVAALPPDGDGRPMRSLADGAGRLEAFLRLDAQAAAAARPTSLVLLDADGEAVAWAGEGLLHEPVPEELPPSGVDYRVGYTAISLFAVAPVAVPGRPWRLVAGRSIAADDVPAVLGGSAAAGAEGWRLAPPGSRRADDEVEITAPGSPSLFLSLDPDRARLPGGADVARRTSAAVVGVLLLAWTLLHYAGSGATRAGAWLAALVAAAGVAALAAAAGAGPLPTVVLAVGSGVAVAALQAPSHRRPELAGGIAALLLCAVAGAVLALGGSVDLAAGFGGEISRVALRVGLALTALGLLALAAGRGPGQSAERGGDGVAWAAVGLLAAAAAAHDLPWLALPVLVAAGAVAARWAHRAGSERRWWRRALAILLAAGLAAVSWETAYRVALRHDLETHYLPRLAPPTGEELTAFQETLQAHFDRLSLDRVPAPSNPAVDPQDLAFTLWRQSPLADLDGLSALVVELPEGRSSRFSFGLSVTERLDIDWDFSRWQVPQVPAWLGAIAEGGGTVTRDGQRVGRVHYWLVPRPGFRLGVSEIEELGEALVRSRAEQVAIDGLPPGVLYALYTPEGRALESPWRSAPPLPAPPAAREEGIVDTPSGRARYWLRQAEDGAEVLYLPLLGVREALERVGTHGFAAATVLAALALLGLAVALPGRLLREALARTVRSYSKRLILVYTLLLLLPLVALNGLLLRELEVRLRAEQVSAGRASLDAARLFLVDFLENLQPGFGIDTAIDRELLEWIASVVQHHVNLYWGSTVYTSSRQELFTAGLLPRRIPGEVYSRLALLGYELGSRTQQAGDLAYGEIYAPLKLPGVPFGAEGLFVSVPLLEQEEEVLRELATLQRRAVLVSSVLFLLLVALGSRLARSFTEPIEELVAGTRRIAAGADRLGTAPPRELELAALAGAIDSMARRVAEARDRVLREKEVVERIVANITSGVVSLDRERRVLLSNRVAEELLGVTPGEPLERAVARRAALAPVASFLARVGTEAVQETVELTEEEGAAREWNLTWLPLPGAEEPAALLVIDDATEVLRGQRLAAWAEMARLIAHEIKNPLTPIQLSTEHLRRVHEAGDPRFGEIFERCTRNILQQVDELREIAGEFSTYSRIPKADLRRGDLAAAVGELVAGYRDAAGRGVEIVLVAGATEVPVRLDERLLGRALRNLLENALRASGGHGRVEVVVERGAAEATVAVRDSGPGVRPELLPRIFDPYFSTHDTGTGLGLAIARRVVEEHGGHIEAQNRELGGLEVRVTLPLAEEEE